MGDYILEEEAIIDVRSSVGSGNCDGSTLGESLGVEFLIEVGSSIGFSGGWVEIKLDGYSV